jgi:hypothetical protein
VLKNSIAVIFVLLIFGVCAAAQTVGTAPEDDNQIWHETVVGIPITKELNLNLTGVLRFGGGRRDFVDNRAGVGFSYKVNKYLTAGSGYLYRVTEFVRNRKNYENRFIGFFALGKSFGKFNVSDRNQFEFHARNSRPDKFNYRNRLLVERVIKRKKFEIKPFASAEAFYDSQFDKFSRLWLTIGANKKLFKNLSLDVYYLRQQDGQSRPGNLNVFGTTLRFNFDFFEINK